MALSQLPGNAVPAVIAKLREMLPFIGAGLLRGAGALLLAAQAFAADSPRNQGSRLYHRGQLLSAARHFATAAKQNPRDPLPRLDAAVVYRDIGDHKKSLQWFKQAGNLLPTDGDVQAALGWSAMRAGSPKEARAAFAAARHVDAEHPQALLGLAQLDLLAGKPSAALKTANILVEEHPSFTLGYVVKARAHTAGGSVKDAVRSYEMAFKSDWTYTEVRQWLGPMYTKLKRFNDAWRQYTRILNVSPKDKIARAQRTMLARRITKKPSQLIRRKKLKKHLPLQVSEGAVKMPLIRVGVGTTASGKPAHKKEIAFVCSGAFDLIDPETGLKMLSGPGGKTWVVRRLQGGKKPLYEIRDHRKRRVTTFRRVVAVRPKNLRKHSTIFQRLALADGTAWEAQGDRQLKGIVEIRNYRGRGVYLVNQVPLEDYVYGVINEEMPSRFPSEALKAQAVIARNHALITKRLRHHKATKYDLCDGQHCQVYSGVGGEHKKGRGVVNATRGLILTYKGSTAQTPYSSNCGGHTQSSGEVPNWWNAAYLKGRRDDLGGKVDRKSPWENEMWLKTSPDVFCNVTKYMHPSQFRWTRVIDAHDLANRIRRRKAGFGRLRSIRILKRSQSGNVNKVEFIGSGGRYIVNRENRIRGIFGLGSIRSTMFLMEVDRDARGVPTDIWFFGGGWGHGVGLCQIGAAGRAGIGRQSYREILAHYFPGTKLKSLGY
jgi:stage II sporulation protein D